MTSEWTFESYVEANRHKPRETILAGLEERDLWKGTPYESPLTLAKHLKDRSEDESFDEALGEMVRLAHKIASQQGASDEESWRVALDAVSGPTRMFRAFALRVEAGASYRLPGWHPSYNLKAQPGSLLFSSGWVAAFTQLTLLEVVSELFVLRLLA